MRAYFAILVLLGCTAPKPVEPPPPPIVATTSAWAGSALTGARATPPQAWDPGAQGLVVECTWSLGEGYAELAPKSLEAGSGLQVALGAGAPFRPVSGARGSVRLAMGATLQACDAAFAADAALAPDVVLVAPGTTAGWRVTARATGADLARVDVHLAEDGRAMLSVVAPAGDEDDEGAWIDDEEQHFLDLGSLAEQAPAAGRAAGASDLARGLALVFAGRAPGEPPRDLAARLRLRRVEVAAEGQLLDRTLALVAGSAAETERRAQGWSRGTGRLAELAAARADLLEPTHGRAAWLHIANLVGAEVAQDYGFLADEGDLAEAARVVHVALEPALGRGAPAPDVAPPALLGLVVDGALLRHLAARAQEGRLGASPRALLLAHAGEVGRWPATLDELTRTARSLEDLSNLFAAENTTFLEDPDPAARARAHDWLRARGKAVPSFDPLGEEESREAALAAWYETREVGQ